TRRAGGPALMLPSLHIKNSVVVASSRKEAFRMKSVIVEQALFRREHGHPPVLLARSAGFTDDWCERAERMIVGFGQHSRGLCCPTAIFGQPLGKDHVAVVRVGDSEAHANGWPQLNFHFAILRRVDYEAYFADPFAVAARLKPPANSPGELTTLSWPAAPPEPRSLAQVQAVLQRVKAGALQEDEDPETVERTVENSESPALLGGSQVLVDGGRLVFVRDRPDEALVQGLWMLLPHSLRAKLWPASFAFCNDLRFDVVVVPHLRDGDWRGYTTEEQAADYPTGSYELALQTAVEAGDQAALDAVFCRRTAGETLRLAVQILVFLGIVMLAVRLLVPVPRLFTPERQACLAAGMVAVGDPWTAVAMWHLGKELDRRDQAAQR
ncbi:MAG: hypothetical protein NZO58_11140, partial [Gemmataceae bacterium]|nr:hypothetical protein [Gemmataceae bacterium]